MLDKLINLTFNDIAGWSSIISLVISIISLALIGSLRAKIIEQKRKARLRQLFEDVRRIPNDALPLTTATRSKLLSLARNLPKGWLCHFSAKSKAAWDIHKAIKSEDIASIHEGIEDWISHSEDL